MNSVSINLALPEQKVENILRKCHSVLNSKLLSIRQIKKAVGMLTASVQPVLPSPLHYSRLWMAQIEFVINFQQYDATVTLPASCREEVQWWIHNLQNNKSKPVIMSPPNLTITSDASKTWWGQSATLLEQGQWKAEGSGLHIQILELMRASFAGRTFCNNRSNIHVHLMMDNVPALSYISKMGGTKYVTLFEIAKGLWDFCLPREILFDGGILTWYSEQRIRLGVQKPQPLQQVETESSSVHPAPTVNGSSGCGPVCFQSQFSVESERELEAGSGSLEA